MLPFAAFLHLSSFLAAAFFLTSVSPSALLLHRLYILLHFLYTSLLLSIRLPATLSLTDRKTNVRSERLFNLKLCCLALNISSVLSVCVCVCVLRSLRSVLIGISYKPCCTGEFVRVAGLKDKTRKSSYNSTIVFYSSEACAAMLVYFGKVWDV